MTRIYGPIEVDRIRLYPIFYPLKGDSGIKGLGVGFRVLAGRGHFRDPKELWEGIVGVFLQRVLLR